MDSIEFYTKELHSSLPWTLSVPTQTNPFPLNCLLTPVLFWVYSHIKGKTWFWVFLWLLSFTVVFQESGRKKQKILNYCCSFAYQLMLKRVDHHLSSKKDPALVGRRGFNAVGQEGEANACLVLEHKYCLCSVRQTQKLKTIPWKPPQR